MGTFDDRLLGLWVCDDGRAVKIARAGDALRVTITDPDGRPFDYNSDVYTASTQTIDRPAAWETGHRMPYVSVEIGKPGWAHTYKLHVAVADRSPDAKFQYRAATSADPLADVILVPDLGGSWADAVVNDPYEDGYMDVPWMRPWLNFSAVACRAIPHPAVKTQSYWEIEVTADLPLPSPGREQPQERAPAGFLDRCAACGRPGTEFVSATDDSGTGWRQFYVTSRCPRCERYSRWHYND